ncbi:hypothetical protein [Actinokineospora iranica]|uniref:hypothetical protein n=1 Tax=Actinokineospora iranica TaxID=1271860 RepID=UPI001113B997|nr:hypothetical protein [Actinokineospora iranica]
MDHEGTGGYSTSSEAFDRYVNETVTPALENFDLVASRLYSDTGVSYTQMLGKPLLAGGHEFTDACRRMLDTFFDVHGTMTERQQNLVHIVSDFRDKLLQTNAAYMQQEADAAHSLTRLAGGLETRLNSDGTTR